MGTLVNQDTMSAGTKTIGIIGGTPIDTRMGQDFVEKQGHKSIGRAAADNLEDQARMQVLEKEKLYGITLEKIRELSKEGAEGVIIYCNSLSSSLDLEKLRQEALLPLVTPLDVYKNLAPKYKLIMLLSAANTSNMSIEHIMREQNQDLTVIGVSVLPVVSAIENNEDPSKIFTGLGLKKFSEAALELEAEAIFLACTHFPYFEAEINAFLKGKKVEVINPAVEMVDLLCEKI